MTASQQLLAEAVAKNQYSELAENQNPEPCILLQKLNISGWTAEEITAINMAWERQPEWAHDFIIDFFVKNIGNFKGMEKQRVIILMDSIYYELTKEQLPNRISFATKREI